MAEEKKSGYCKDCRKQVVVFRKGTNHILHLLLTICTGGLWLIVWFGNSVKFGGWRCSQCGLTNISRRPDVTTIAKAVNFEKIPKFVPKVLPFPKQALIPKTPKITKVCSGCGKTIDGDAEICKYCDSDQYPAQQWVIK